MSSLRLAGEGWAASFDTTAGTFDLFHEDVTLASGCTAHVYLRGATLSSEGGFDSFEPVPGGFLFRKESDGGKLLLSAESRGGALVLRAGVACGPGEHQIDFILPVRVPPGGLLPGVERSSRLRFFCHGYQCWTPTASLKRSRPGDYLLPSFFPKRLKPMLLNPSTPVASERGRFESEWLGGVADLEGGRSFVVGFTGVSRALSRVSTRLTRDPALRTLEACSMLEGVPAREGEEVWGEPLALIPGDLTGAGLELYAEMLASEQGVAGTRHAPTGWCSWYQYFTKVTAADVHKNVELLSGMYSHLGTGLLQIDDGYAPAVGDWLETSEGFAVGLEAVADEIKSRGMVPGIWVAPFTVIRKSKIFKEHRDWLVSNAKGKPILAGVSPDWGGRFYGLDLTREEVLERIGEVFTTLRATGFSFFKLDFLASGLLEGKRHDESKTRAEAARRALHVIREAVGDSHLMAAGGPVLLGAGILDSQRVSGDVAPAWRHFWQPLLRDRSTPGVRNSILNTLERSFLSGRVFEGDPDCMMARSSGSKLTLDERRTLGSVMAVFGGSFLFSDDLSTWGAEEEELMSKLLPSRAARCACPDVWKREVPRLLTSQRSDPSGPYLLAVAINWSGGGRKMKVALDELGAADRCHVYEFWTGKYLGVAAGELALGEVPAHGCVLLRLTPTSAAPTLIGSDVNASMGGVELAKFEHEEGRISLELRVASPRKANVHFSIPGAAEVRSGEGSEVSRVRGDVFRVSASVDERMSIELSYEKGLGGR